ncbi:Uncharacterised protein [Kingella potus]|uniref:Uncharacterized protein n=1 Tax=Kingella potus TaxID=265175 RepID=A0A377R2E0_9NEIS|nr:hypothetical protein [Kingella potus]UOP00557.1 hypothetical protein LVJ84_12065 [Kingella potus]UOP01989.1 hypothetical protein LVJ84_14540 [Kingella potus]STQ99821.1 Uncharacterised protein [Kingella potus]STR03049.1 Uncharacterised protein [Kingella potus]STR03060.1 Uncharacterised protein [Kingella potus]
MAASTAANEHIYQLPASLYFRTDRPVQIGELVTSLQSLEKITARMPKLLGTIANVQVLRTELLVNEIQAGSIWEDFIVSVVFGNEEEMIKFSKYMNGVLREHPVEIGSILIGGMLVFGIYKAIAWAKGDSSKDANHIEIKNNTIIQIGAETVEKSPEQFVEIIKSTVGAHKSIAKEAVNVIAPAKKEKGSSISFGGKNEDLPTLDAGLIESVPGSLNIDPESSSRDFYDIDLNIRKLNRDGDTGWEALMPPHITRRLKLTFADGISHEDIDGKFEFRADVKVFYKPQGRSRTLTPYEIMLISLVEN